MSHLIVIVYPTESKAEEVRQTLLGLQKEYVIKLGDAVIATKTDAGKIKLNQLINTTTTGAVPAASGGCWSEFSSSTPFWVWPSAPPRVRSAVP